MDRIVERLVRLITAARNRGDDATRILAYSRLMAMAGQPGFRRSLDRALTITRWW